MSANLGACVVDPADEYDRERFSLESLEHDDDSVDEEAIEFLRAYTAQQETRQDTATAELDPGLTFTTGAHSHSSGGAELARALTIMPPWSATTAFTSPASDPLGAPALQGLVEQLVGPFVAPPTSPITLPPPS